MAIKVAECQCLFFAGFYESIYSNSLDNDMEYDCSNPEEWGVTLKDGCELDWSDFDVDYDQWKKDVVRDYISVYKDHLPDFVEDIVDCDVDSPKFYNFRTDEIYGTFVLADNAIDKMVEYLNDHRESMSAVIRERHTSCDGFWSFMSNDIDEWIKELRKPADELDGRYISRVIGYIMEAEYDGNESLGWDLNYEVYENICNSEYYHLSDEAIENNVASQD